MNSTRILFLLVLTVFSFYQLSAQTLDELSSDTTDQASLKEEIPIYNPAEIKSRIQKLNIPVKPEYTPAVESYIKTYVVRNREKSERILGKTLMYFPLFEKFLRENKLPAELKYLSVVESALNPTALSRAGAYGLWQFMPQTGKIYGLQIDKYRDDRSDPHKSTAAAAQYLKRLYEKYEDWALAIAAYNSGPGRVNRAIKLSRSKNFWSLCRYLPKETRNYVPAFIGAAYLLNFYEQHNLQPNYPDLDMQLTETTLVYRSLSFLAVAQITGLAVELVKELNPSYKMDFLPENIEGNNLTLPKRVMTALKDFLESENPDAEHRFILESEPVYTLTTPLQEQKDLYFKSTYTVVEEQELEKLADYFGCPAHCVKAWNNLKTNKLSKGQEIVVYKPREYKRFETESGLASKPETIPPPEIKIVETVPKHPIKSEKSGKVQKTPPETFTYQLKKGESLIDVVEKFPGNSVWELIQLNNISRQNPLPQEAKIKVRKY